MQEGGQSRDNGRFGARGAPAYLPAAAIPADLPERPLPIAEMADIFGVTHRTLHFYEERGLLSARRIGPMRIYEHEEIMRMAVINACRESGMPVAVVQELMEELSMATSQAEADAAFRQAMTVRSRELAAEMSTLHRQLNHARGLLEKTDSLLIGSAAAGREAIQLPAEELRHLQLMAEGLSAAKIAEMDGITTDAALAVERSIAAKLGAANRFQAIAKGVVLGLVGDGAA